jgi:RNA polymerase sigma-70 factor, ECF subfamily
MALIERGAVPSQLQTIYSSNADFVWRTLLRMGIARDDANDAVQDVFLVVHQQLATFEGRSALSTWLFTICRTVAAKRRRLYRREREQIAQSNTDDIIDLRADVGRTAEHNQDLNLLETILATLDTHQRNVFILFEIEKMSGEAISEALAIPLGTVYSRLQLARNSFRQALARHQTKDRFATLRAGENS